MATPLLIGIAGCSGSGKTWLAQKIQDSFPSHTSRLSIDWYYRDLAHLPPEVAGKTNFDHPDSIDKQRLIQDFQTLKQGRAIDAPVYDFSCFSRVEDSSNHVDASPLLLIEGIFALHFTELAKHYHESVFVDTPIELCFARRLQRDQQERGYSEAQIRHMWEATVVDSFARFVKPSASIASRIWKSEEDKTFVTQFLADLQAYLARNADAPTRTG